MFASMIGIVAYVLGALGFYSIANRRGIRHAWLAWVPIGNLWLLGCISDQYQSMIKGKVNSKRKILLALGIVQALCLIALLVLCVAMLIQLASMGVFALDQEFSSDIYGDGAYPGDFYTDSFSDIWDQEMVADIMGIVLPMVAVYGILCLVSLPLLVLQYMALYDVFRSCDPGNSTLFLLLSIFLGISSFLVFVCRDKNYGMMRPVNRTTYTQPPAPEAEPWEQESE